MTLSKYIFLMWISLMTIVSLFLIAEYRYFKQQSEQLEQLKDDYANYVLALKKLIVDYGALKESQNPELDSKKKTLDINTRLASNQENEANFLLVNRDYEYLKKSALKFARTYNLEVALQSMYEAETFPIYINNPKLRKRNRRSKSSRRLSKASDYGQSTLDRLKKFKKEPVFIWPLDRSQFWLSSSYGPRKNPDGSWGFHTGVDMGAVKGTLIKAVGDGVIVQASYCAGYGNTIVISHNRRFKTRYAHLDKILVSVGQRVMQGDFIGKVGATGNVRTSKRGGDASHLHFEVCVYGKHVNPFYFLA